MAGTGLGPRGDKPACIGETCLTSPTTTTKQLVTSRRATHRRQSSSLIQARRLTKQKTRRQREVI